MSQALKEHALRRAAKQNADLNEMIDSSLNDDQEGYLYAQALQILNDGNKSPLDQCHIDAIIEVNRKEFLYGN